MWVKKQCLEILYSNWPEVLYPYILSGVESISPNPSENDLKTLRKLHMNSLVELSNGTIVVSKGGGYASEGTSIIAVSKSLYIKNRIYAVASFIAKNKDKIINRTYDKKNLCDIPFNIRLSRIDNSGIYVTLNYDVELFFDYKNYSVSNRKFSTCRACKIFVNRNAFIN